jgi:hypothetical protein
VVVKEQRRLPHEERLGLAVAFLERLDEERCSCGDPNLSKAIEERIIWRELLDLELQKFDEDIERLAEFAHILAPNVGTVTQPGGETQQQPQGDIPPSPWRRLGRFFR